MYTSASHIAAFAASTYPSRSATSVGYTRLAMSNEYRPTHPFDPVPHANTTSPIGNYTNAPALSAGNSFNPAATPNTAPG